MGRTTNKLLWDRSWQNKLPMYANRPPPQQFSRLFVVFRLPEPLCGARERTRDVTRQSCHRSRIRRAGHGSRRGMAIPYYVDVIPPANSVPDRRRQQFVNFHPVDAFCWRESARSRLRRRAATRGREAAAGRIRSPEPFVGTLWSNFIHLGWLRGLRPGSAEGWTVGHLRSGAVSVKVFCFCACEFCFYTLDHVLWVSMTVWNEALTKTSHHHAPAHQPEAMRWVWRHYWACCTGKGAAGRSRQCAAA